MTDYLLADHIHTVGKIRDVINSSGSIAGLIMLSGAHMYEFPSKNSDYDYRGFYIMKTGRLLEIKHTREHDLLDPKLENEPLADVSLSEIRRFMFLAINMNCNTLEHLFASRPLDITTEALELRSIINHCMTKKGLYDSYKGMAEFNYKKFISTGKKKTIKKYLYIFRALFAGIHALKNGEIQPSIVKLNLIFDNRIVKNLIEDKISGLEDDKIILSAKYERIDDMVDAYMEVLDQIYMKCDLPLEPTKENWEKCNDFLKDVRRRNWDLINQ